MYERGNTMSKLQEISRLESQRTTAWVVFGISLVISFISFIMWTLNGLALSGCRLFHYASNGSCTTEPTDTAGTFAAISAVIAVISVIMAIVWQSRLSELRSRKD